MPTERFDKAFLAGPTSLDLRAIRRTDRIGLATGDIMSACDGGATHGLFSTDGVVGADVDLPRARLTHGFSITLIHRRLAKNHLTADDHALTRVILGACALGDLLLPLVADGDREASCGRHFTSNRVTANRLLEALAALAALLHLL